MVNCVVSTARDLKFPTLLMQPYSLSIDQQYQGILELFEPCALTWGASLWRIAFNSRSDPVVLADPELNWPQAKAVRANINQ